jgi:hypothetical protein
MMVHKHVRYFWKILKHPRVIIFIAMGSAIIFLTFLTNNNALEIAISGIASVFIGIGVNNFSAQENHDKELQKRQSLSRHAISLLELSVNKAKQLRELQEKNGSGDLPQELQELEQLLALVRQLLSTGY